MKRIQVAVFLALWIPAASLLAAEGAGGGSGGTGAVVKQVEGAGGAKTLLQQMWQKLRAYGPKLEAGREPARAATQAVGVRGAEATSTQLNPYWKDDKSSDPAYQQEVAELTKAQDLADSDAPGAARALEEFLKNHPASALKPNAQFALALAHGTAGDKARGRAAAEGFLKDNPAHPLADDARRLIAQLQ